MKWRGHCSCAFQTIFAHAVVSWLVTRATGQVLAVDGGLLTGYGEDMRGIVRKRIVEAKTKKAAHRAGEGTRARRKGAFKQ